MLSQFIRDEDEFVSSSEDLTVEMCLSNGSEWVPSEWESDKNITIIHSPSVNIWTKDETNPALTGFTNAVNGCRQISIIHSTPVHQLTSGEDKRWVKSSNKTFITKTP